MARRIVRWYLFDETIASRTEVEAQGGTIQVIPNPPPAEDCRGRWVYDADDKVWKCDIEPPSDEDCVGGYWVFHEPTWEWRCKPDRPDEDCPDSDDEWEFDEDSWTWVCVEDD